MTEGSVNPREVLAHVAQAEQTFTTHARWHGDRTAHVGRAVDRLVGRARTLAAGATLP